MALGPYREEDKARLLVNRVIVPQRGGKQLRLKVKSKEVLVELSVSDVEVLGDIRAGHYVDIILHSLVERAKPGTRNKFKLESGWANGHVEGRVDEKIGGRWNGIIFHVGGGLKSYVDMDMDCKVDPSQIGDDEWWRFDFSLPHQCITVNRAD